MLLRNQKNNVNLFEKSVFINKYSKNKVFNLRLNLYKYNIIIGLTVLSSCFLVYDPIFAESSLNSPTTIVNSTEVETLFNKLIIFIITKNMMKL